MMKCIPILVLVITSVFIIMALFYLENSSHKFPTRHIREGFETEQSKNDYIYKETPGDISNEIKNRSGSNLIGNGNFQNKHDIDGHYGSSYGNEIVSHPNPGKGRYVLRQSVSLHSRITKYKIAINVQAGHYYKLSSWVYDTHHTRDNLDDLYNLVYHLRNNNSVKYVAKSVSLQTSTVDGNIWNEKSIVFQIPTELNGSLDIVLQFDSKKHEGHRYITDVRLEKYHPLLKDFPLSHQLAFFLSSSIEKGFKREDGRLWKDISNNGKDFQFTQPTIYTGNAISLDNNMIIGPPCSELGIKANKFTIGWYMKSKHVRGKKTFMRLFTSAENGSSLDISYYSNHQNYTSLHVDFLGTTTKWDIGLSGNNSLYQLIYNGRKFNLYKNGLLIISHNKNTPTPTPTHTSIPFGGDVDKYGCKPSTGERWCVAKMKCLPINSCPTNSSGDGDGDRDGDGDLYFINKPLLINPNRDIHGSISNIFAFATALTNEQVEEINKYFQCSPCKKNQIDNPSSNPTIKPIHEHTVTKINETNTHIIEEEQEDRQMRCKILLEQDNINIKNQKELERISILYNAQKLREPTPTHGPNMINSLVKAFNKKEEDTNDPCTKIIYNIKPDGQVIRKKMRVPNCEECPVENSINTSY